MSESTLPEIAESIELYQTRDAVREYAQNNHNYWRWIQGGLALVRKSPLDFDPIGEYWHCTERRILVAFFVGNFRERYAPAPAMRQLAFKTFRHFDAARSDGRFGDRQLATLQSGMWPSFCKMAIEVANELPPLPEYDALREVWGHHLRAQSLREELVSYLDAARTETKPDNLEQPFYKRLAWFPYIGLDKLDDLPDRQRFFYGYYNLLATTHSYIHGGSISFAPVIQNNPTGEILAYVEKWDKGQSPHDTKFEVEGKSERRDRSHHAPVIELFGFLNLHRIPFNNSVTANTYAQFERIGDASPYDRLTRVGKVTRGYLEKNPSDVERFAAWFRDLTLSPPADPTLQIEGIRSERIAAARPEDVAQQIEVTLLKEMHEAAVAKALEFSDIEAATAMMHLMVDATIYGRGGNKPPPLSIDIKPPSIKPPTVRAERLRLPAGLRIAADDALGYLRAGYHVLFAGPPGTGKTTVAQLVGHAWNQNLSLAPDEILLAEAPPTTVGNSAWAPFHTIGGILPTESGKFAAAKGIFIDPSYEEGDEWQLRGECLVLDEMNRADLDRCIGELYPLLSRSVERVHPAGIPGVSSIRNNPLFRIIATVNDATLDDVVFPISEGLARRFIRLELLGATEEDLHLFLQVDKVNEDKRAAAVAVLKGLYEICEEDKRITTSELGKHLPFGVGYFATLRAWVRGELTLSREFSERDLLDCARVLVVTSLTSAARLRGLDRLLDRLTEIGDRE